jgi:hypothetical protein
MNSVLRNGSPIQVESETLTIAYRDAGREQFAHVVLLRDPDTGLYWWRRQDSHSREDQIDFRRPPWFVYFTETGAVGFSFLGTLMIRDLGGRESDMVSAERTVLAAIGSHARQLLDGEAPWTTYVLFPPSVPHLPQDFVKNPAYSIFPGPLPEVVGVAHGNNMWTVRLKNWNDDFMDVALDGNFAPMDVRRVAAR